MLIYWFWTKHFVALHFSLRKVALHVLKISQILICTTLGLRH
jgi:hypothetical protein